MQIQTLTGSLLRLLRLLRLGPNDQAGLDITSHLDGLFKLCCDHHVRLDSCFMTLALAVEVMEGISKVGDSVMQ
jgi:hypothetical protein